MTRQFRLPAEWEKQSYIQLTWPHIETDWNYMLDEVEDCFYNIAKEIATRQPLLLVAPHFPKRLQNTPFSANITYFECSTNDTWARDHGFITLVDDIGNAQLLDFQFNGWGMKFAANLDNQINRRLHESHKILQGEYVNRLNFVLEGGSIESDGMGTLLTTSSCLLAPNRNQPMKRSDIETSLKDYFNVNNVLWIDYGYLSGDDTDSHVDTLARLCPNNTIVFVGCNDKLDEHYNELNQMKQQLTTFTNSRGEPFRLLELPMPDSIFDSEGLRLPATYANFLIMNNVILYPTYNQKENDVKAAMVLNEAFPGYEIIGINCNALIKQHGSLHCVTMQYPKCVK